MLAPRLTKHEQVRVRALEAEQRLQRLEYQQNNMNTALIAGLLLNTGIVLSALSPTGAAPLTARMLLWAGSAGVAKWGLGVLKLQVGRSRSCMFSQSLVPSRHSDAKPVHVQECRPRPARLP